jgi:hypothetical protein
MTGHVFVSYAREDADFVLPLAQALLRSGVDLWVDQLRINPADNWDKSIDDALYDCAKLLLFLSPAAVASSEVLSELRVAFNEGKPVVPVLYQTCRPDPRAFPPPGSFGRQGSLRMTVGKVVANPLG